MHILVLVKQVPDTLNVTFDREDFRLIRDQEQAVINPFDLCALEAAARLKDQDEEIQIYAMSMGEHGTESVLRDALAVCADQAALISDPKLKGSDTVTTAHVLAAAVKKIEADAGITFDLICCGTRAIDGGTSAIGPMLGILLDRPFISDVLSCQIQDDDLIVNTETDTEMYRAAVKLPCICSFTKADYSPRYPKVIRIIEAQDAQIWMLSAAQLSLSEWVGSDHAITVRSVKYHRLKKKSHIIKNKDPETAAKILADMLIKERIV